MNQMHEANRKRWDATAPRWRALRDRDGGWRRCHVEPSLGLEGRTVEFIERYVGDLYGKRACVLASGDNYAAFALAGLGARVTSVDISQEQLNVAAERASQLGLSVEFVRGDVTHLPDLGDDVFDFACSTNGVTVWLTNLDGYYAEAWRILKPGGIFLSYDIHPFQRPWGSNIERLKMVKPYFDHSPKEYLYHPDGEIYALAAEVPQAERQGKLSGFRCHWTMNDLLMGLIENGFELLHVSENPSTDPRFWHGSDFEGQPNPELLDWRKNPRAGLPVWLTLVARKRKM